MAHPQVILSSRDGDKFFRLSEAYIRGNTIKYLRVSEQVLEKAQVRGPYARTCAYAGDLILVCCTPCPPFRRRMWRQRRTAGQGLAGGGVQWPWAAGADGAKASIAPTTLAVRFMQQVGTLLPAFVLLQAVAEAEEEKAGGSGAGAGALAGARCRGIRRET